MKKKPLSPEQHEDAMRLKSIFESKKKQLGFSQESIAYELGMRQSAVAQLLNGVNPLNMSNAAKFAKLLGVCVNDFSPTLAEKIAEVSASIQPTQTRHLSREEERLLDMFSSLPKRDKEIFLNQISERKDEVDQLFEEIIEARKIKKII
ncbi:transcriptional repressor DicA [Sodalis glossinidius str. 'morsitans']|uniref:Transcriptional repressor DicA n=1 Tax=Sodalis glossinidius (strain morsitans) TaxID=343509 RepID=A0A193QHB9_SODGM|nr:transcriptional repressor DicA [Sodalis glossinidius str. 'morsitans']